MSGWRPKIPFGVWCALVLPLIIGILPLLLGLAVLTNTGDGWSFTEMAREWKTSTFFTIQLGLFTGTIVAVAAPLFAFSLLFLPQTFVMAIRILATSLFCLPSTVLALGLISSFGQNGFLNKSLEFLHLDVQTSGWIYSQYALLLVTITGFLPFASMLLHQAILRIPTHEWESATLIGLSKWRTIKKIALPSLKQPLLLISLLAFANAIATFGAASILGGGPKSQTLEVSTFISIYALANWKQAAVYAFTQGLLGLTATIGIILITQSQNSLSHTNEISSSGMGLDDRGKKILSHPQLKWTAWFLGLCLTLLMLIPFLGLMIDTLSSINSSDIDLETLSFLAKSAWTSFMFSVPAAFLSVMSAYFIASGYFTLSERYSVSTAKTLLILIMTVASIPGVTLGFGILALESLFKLEQARTMLQALILAVISVPASLSVLMPRYQQSIKPYLPVKRLLNLKEIFWFRRVEWKVLLSPALLCFAISFVWSMNETSLVSLLGDPLDPALSTALIQLAGKYRFNTAALSSLLLISLNIIVISLSLASNQHEEFRNQ